MFEIIDQLDMLYNVCYPVIKNGEKVMEMVWPESVRQREVLFFFGVNHNCMFIIASWSAACFVFQNCTNTSVRSMTEQYLLRLHDVYFIEPPKLIFTKKTINSLPNKLEKTYYDKIIW